MFAATERQDQAILDVRQSAFGSPAMTVRCGSAPMSEANENREARWSWLQESIDQLCARMGSINTSQQQLAVKLMRSSDVVDKMRRNQHIIAKQLEATNEALIQLTLSQRSALTDGLGTNPASIVVCADSQTFAEPNVLQVFDEMPKQQLGDEIEKMAQTKARICAKDSPVEKWERSMHKVAHVGHDQLLSRISVGTEHAAHESFKVSMSPVVSEGAALQVFDEMHHEDTLWDDESIHSIDSHDGLLQQLAQGGAYLDADERKPTAQMFINGGFSEISPEMVMQDEEASFNFDTQNNLLQILALGGDNLDSDKAKPMNQMEFDDVEDIIWDEELSAGLDTYHGLLQQSSYLVDEESNTIAESVVSEVLTQDGFSSFIFGVAIDIGSSMFEEFKDGISSHDGLLKLVAGSAQFLFLHNMDQKLRRDQVLNYEDILTPTMELGPGDRQHESEKIVGTIITHSFLFLELGDAHSDQVVNEIHDTWEGAKMLEEFVAPNFRLLGSG